MTRRWHLLALPALLAWHGAGRPARAMFGPAPARLDPPPAAMACLEDPWVFLLDEAVCATCIQGLGVCRCDDRSEPTLRYFRRRADGDGIDGTVGRIFHLALPGTAFDLKAGPDRTLLVADRQGGITRIFLATKGASWRVARTESLLGEAERKTLGLPAGPPRSFAVAQDGSLVMAYGRGIVQVPAQPGKAGREAVKWLLGKAPSGEEAGAAGPGLALAMDDGGRVLVVDPELRLVYRIDPASGAKELLAQKESWPTREFRPVEVACAGGSVFVAGRLGAQATTRRLFALNPNPETGRNEARDLKVAMAAGVTFTVSPDRHLLLWNGQTREAQFRANRQTRAAAVHQEAKAHAAAKASLEQLVQAEERQADRKDRAAARNRLAATAAVPAEHKDPPAGASPRGPDAPAPAGASTVIARLRQFARGPLFHGAFGAWIQDQGTADPGASAALAGLLRRADLACPGLPAAAVPARFALEPAVLERAVRWMLEHADLANDPMELKGWRRHSRTAARVTFGLSGCRGEGGMVLEIHELQDYAAAMDAGAATGPVRAALRATGGRTGLHVARDGQARFAYGLRVVLTPGLDGFRLIRPGGAQSLEHWDDGPDPAAPAVAPAGEAGTACGTASHR